MGGAPPEITERCVFRACARKFNNTRMSGMETTVKPRRTIFTLP